MKGKGIGIYRERWTQRSIAQLGIWSSYGPFVTLMITVVLPLVIASLQ